MTAATNPSIHPAEHNLDDRVMVESVGSSEGVAVTLQVMLEPGAKTSLRLIERLGSIAMFQLTERIRRGEIDKTRHDLKEDKP